MSFVWHLSVQFSQCLRCWITSAYPREQRFLEYLFVSSSRRLYDLTRANIGIHLSGDLLHSVHIDTPQGSWQPHICFREATPPFRPQRAELEAQYSPRLY